MPLPLFSQTITYCEKHGVSLAIINEDGTEVCANCRFEELMRSVEGADDE